MFPFEQQPTIVEPRSLQVIHSKLELIFKCLSKLYNQSPYCSALLDVNKAILEHYKQALGYINKLRLAIQIQYPHGQIVPLSLEQMIQLSPQYSSKIPPSLQPKMSIESINTQIYQLTIHLDQLAYMLRDCPDLEHRPLVRNCAQAMTELFQLQQFYIYPFHPELIPDYLKKVDFQYHFESIIK